VRPLLSLKRRRLAIRRFFQTNTHRHMSPKKSSPFTIRTVCFRTTMRAATFRALIEAAVERAAVLNDSFIVGADPSLFRIMGMAQHGDILMSHCKFADPIGIRLAFRYRHGDFAIIDRIIVALGLDIEPAPCMGKGSLMPFEDRSVGHMLLDVADKLPAGRQLIRDIQEHMPHGTILERHQATLPHARGGLDIQAQGHDNPVDDGEVAVAVTKSQADADGVGKLAVAHQDIAVLSHPHNPEK